MSGDALAYIAFAIVVAAVCSIQYWLDGRGKTLPQGGKPRPIWAWDVRFVAPLVFIALILRSSGRLMRENWFGLGRWANIGIILGVGAFGIFLFAVWLRGRARLKQLAEEIDYALCPACGYPLKGLPARHVCPECGQPYDLSVVRTKWYRGFLR